MKLNCSEQAKRCSAAQRSHLPGGSTARCHPHPLIWKENCHWEKKLFFQVFFLLLTSRYLFFSDKKRDFSKCPTDDFCSSQLFFFLTQGLGLLWTVITEDFLLYQDPQQLNRERARNTDKMEIKKNNSVLMKSEREGHLLVICSTIPDKRSLVIQSHWMTLIKIWALRAGYSLLNRLAGQKDREREGRSMGVDQNHNELN